MMITERMMMNRMSGNQEDGKWTRNLFNKALRNPAVTRIIALLSSNSNLLKSLDSASRQRQNANRHYLGLRTVAISQIRGSEARSRDFDSSFHPLSERTFYRWSSVAQARQQGIPLPPVELIKVGETYFVRDGHHRISVARAFGEQFIEAEVTEW